MAKTRPLRGSDRDAVMPSLILLIFRLLRQVPMGCRDSDQVSGAGPDVVAARCVFGFINHEAESARVIFTAGNEIVSDFF